MSFGGAHGKDTGSYVNAAKDAIATMAANTPEITIKNDEQNFNATLFKEEYEKIYTDVVENTTPIIKALNELPVYFCNEFFCSNLVASGFFCGFMADSWRKGAVLVLSSRGE